MIDLPNNSQVKVHDIFDILPSFMLAADTIFVDIPYNQSLLTNYSLRDNVRLHTDNTIKIEDFLKRLFECVKQINPRFLFIECGKELLPDIILLCKDQYKYVTFYNSTYYRNKDNKSYVIHATNTYKQRRYKELEDKDESDIVAWLCANHTYNCIGDLCMGKGLVGREAYKNGKMFVGTELNEGRLMELVKWITKQELKK